MLRIFLLGCMLTISSCKKSSSLVLTEQDYEFAIVIYKKAWIDGANASTNSVNTIGTFNDSIGKLVFQKDSLKFVCVLNNL